MSLFGQPSRALVESVKRHEGLRLKSYQDSEGVWTIGYGRNLQTMEISEALAEEWLKEDLKSARRDVLSLNDTAHLSSNRKDVLIEMAFNLGVVGLLKFKRMWSRIRANDFKGAALEMMDSKWATQVGTRADRLATRMREG